MEKYLTKFDACLCAFLALAFSSSFNYIHNGDCAIDGVYLLSAFAFFVFLIGINAAIRREIVLFYKHNTNESSFGKSFCNCFFESKKSLFKTALLIFICWLPVLLVLYPGTFINDTWGQLQQFMAFIDGGSLHRNVLSDHHPFFDTLLIGSIIVPFSKFTGAWHVAIFLYVLLQAFITSLVFSYSVKYVYEKLNIGRVVSIGILAFYCIVPVYATSVQTVSKDALFSWIYVLFFVFFMEIVRTDGNALNGKLFFIKFLLVIVFCIMTKKVGFYVVIGSILTLLISYFHNKKRIIISLVVAICMIGFILPVMRHTLGVHAGGMQEMFSIPFQQTARYVKYYPNDITLDEKNAIDKVLGFDNLVQRYDPISADPVKGYSQKGSKKDYLIYLKTWMAQGIRHPGVYIDSYNAMVSGWFSFHEYNPLMNMNWHNQLDPNKIPEWVPKRNNFSDWTATTYEKTYDTIYRNPFITIFLCYGFYAALIPSFMLATTLRASKQKDIKYWLVAVPMILSIVLGCWLAPVSIHFEGRRYLYPITYTVPLIISWCFYFYKNEVDKHGKCYNEVK